MLPIAHIRGVVYTLDANGQARGLFCRRGPATKES